MAIDTGWYTDVAINGDMIAAGTLNNSSTKIASHSSSVLIEDDTELVFKGGDTYTGKDLKAMLKALKKLATEQYPEEFL